MNNYDKIKQMSVDEMANFIFLLIPMECRKCPADVICNGGVCEKELAKWLLSESEEEK